jgi:Fe2+ or Zn2+ uptake regulation protein
MTLDQYEKLPPEEKEHFAMCEECGEVFDRRSLA